MFKYKIECTTKENKPQQCSSFILIGKNKGDIISRCIKVLQQRKANYISATLLYNDGR